MLSACLQPKQTPEVFGGCASLLGHLVKERQVLGRGQVIHISHELQQVSGTCGFRKRQWGERGPCSP